MVCQHAHDFADIGQRARRHQCIDEKLRELAGGDGALEDRAGPHQTRNTMAAVPRKMTMPTSRPRGHRAA